MTAEDEEGGEAEIWDILDTMGYNRQLQLDQVKTYMYKHIVVSVIGFKACFIQRAGNLGFSPLSSSFPPQTLLTSAVHLLLCTCNFGDEVSKMSELHVCTSF